MKTIRVLKKVKIIVRGGVAYALKIPKGIEVEIKDYDKNPKGDKATYILAYGMIILK